ncbi:TetR/AcrR family transcriptional regulator [bacterium]|nr:TetR/AcrR family transcriptional regulator [bacterium]
MKETGRSTEKTEQMKKTIMKAAAKVFRRSGFQNATVALIAREAGYAASSLYHYFESKDSIYRELSQSILGTCIEIAESVKSEELSFRARVNDLTNRIYEFADQERDFFIFFLTQRMNFHWALNADLAEELIGQYRKFYSLLEVIIGEGIQEEALIRLQVSDLTAFYLGIVRSFFHEWCYQGAQNRLTAKTPIVVNLFFRGAGR